MKCEIKVFKPNGDFAGIIDNAESVTLTRKHRGVGGFRVVVQAGKSGVKALCGLDNIIVINDDSQKAGIVREWSADTSSGGCTVTVCGTTASGLISRRLVVPPTEEEVPGSHGWDRAAGMPADVMRHYMARHVIEPSDSNRKMDNIIFAKCPDTEGELMSWQSRFEPLDRVLEQVAEQSDTGFRVDYDYREKQFLFYPHSGDEKTVGTDNPVVFSTHVGNMTRTVYRECHDNQFTTAYAGGQGEDENRLIQVINPQNTGIQRVESFVDAGGAADIDELLVYSNQQMNKQDDIITITCDEVTNNPFGFEKDYFLGDKVTFNLPEIPITYNARIIEVTEVWENGCPRVDMVFGRNEEDLIKWLDRIENKNPVR